MNEEIINLKTKAKFFKRNELGLIEGVEYKFREDGTVDWRAMVNPAYLVINKSYESSLVKRFLKPLNEIKVSEVEDNKLLILLQGVKELAILRGYSKIQPKVDYISNEKAVVSTQIEWIPNFETSGSPISFGDVGSASLDNTSGFGQMYLEAIATNRAFVRAVRNFLGINVLANDEIDAKATEKFLAKKESPVAQHSPQAVLEKAVEHAGFNFESFKARALEAYSDKITGKISEWKDLSSVSPKDAFILIDLLKKGK